MPRPSTLRVRSLATPMTLRRLAALLDAFGARPERWPAAERAAALDLLRVSRAARRIQSEAAELDTVLDRAPAPAPSAALFDRVLAANLGTAAPPTSSRTSMTSERPPTHVRPVAASGASRPAAGHPGRYQRMLVGGASLATAAALTLWLALGSSPASAPIVPAVPSVEVGSYSTATDVLLALDDLDLGSMAPIIGCNDAGDWGCPDLQVPEERSTADVERRTVT